jgi:UDP-3-O-[3-hydroxymyristoyl] glucosamine N-acyltransferase
MKLGELASRLGAELRGDADLEITGVKGIEEAGPTEITFVANPRYTSLARTTRAAAVLVEPDFQEISAATLRIKNPYLAFSRALGFFYQPPSYAPGIHPTAVIDPNAEIGEGAHIGAYASSAPMFVSGLTPRYCHTSCSTPAFKRAITSSHMPTPSSAKTASSATTSRSKTAPSSARTASASQKTRPANGRKFRSPARCILGSRVDVQANACIDRATVGATEIGDGTKVDNLVQVGHGSRVGENTLLCAQTGLAGSSIGRQQRDSCRPGGHCRPLHRRRRRILTAQSGGLARCPAGQDDLRLSGLRQPHLASRRHHLSAPAGIAQAP